MDNPDYAPLDVEKVPELREATIHSPDSGFMTVVSDDQVGAASQAEPALAYVTPSRPSGASMSSVASAAPGAAPPPRPAPGMMVHKYQLIRELGRGGMGSVFLARDVRLGRLAAIKFLSVSSPQLSQRFIAEARATALCNHENIVVIYDADEYAGMPYMALEYIEGQTLQALMKSHQVTASPAGGDVGMLLPAERVLELAIPILRALQRAHEMGIVHRDLKPANIMLTSAGSIKVLDFGIAKSLSSDENPAAPSAVAAIGQISSMTRTGAIMGTLPYMSPEQLLGRGVDHRTDIWAMGIMLYEMATGRHPLAPLSKRTVLQVLDMSQTMPRLAEQRPDLGQLAHVIDSCLIKPKEDRPATVETLLNDLESLRRGHTTSRLAIDQSPFTGLSAFQESDANRFFGRAEDIGAVSARVRSEPMVAVVGPSGVGKSSLIRAGVIPALKGSGEGWEALVVRPGRQPMAALAELLTGLLMRSSTNRPMTGGGTSERLFDSIAGVDSTSLRTTAHARLAAEPGYLGSELRAWAQRKFRRVLVFVDQFEEIYTQSVDADERAAFLSCLGGVADDASSPLRVVFSIRSDYIERLAEARAFMSQVTRGLMFLAPIGRAGLREALIEPVRSAGYRFENNDMVEHMLDELQNASGALPLLQFTAATLWENRDEARRLLTESSYRHMGGVAGTLARHADAVLAGMSASRVALTRSVFQRLVTPERTRAIISVNELRELATAGQDVESLLQELADARLLVIETGADDGGLVEIVHESLITGWPTLTRWLDENQEDAAFLDRLRNAAIEWVRSGESEGTLWRGDAELEARRWAERYQGPLTTRDRRFLQAVFALASRSQRRKRLIIVSVIGVLVCMVVAATVALISIRQAERKASRQALELERQEKQLRIALIDAEKATVRAQQAQQSAERATEEARESQREAETQREKADDSAQWAREALQQAERDARRAKKAKRRARRQQKRAEAGELRLAELLSELDTKLKLLEAAVGGKAIRRKLRQQPSSELR